jgi:hypothetical protein
LAAVHRVGEADALPALPDALYAGKSAARARVFPALAASALRALVLALYKPGAVQSAA